MSQVYSCAWSTCAARGESGEECRRKALDARVKQLSQNTAIVFCSLQSKFRIAEYSWCIFSPSIPSIYPLPDHSIPQLAKVDYRKWPLRKPGGRKVSLGVQPSIKWMCCFDTCTWLHRWGKRKCCVWWWRFCDLYESSELDKLNAIQWLPTWFLMFVAACLIAHGCDYFLPLISLLDYLWALTWQRPTFTLERTCFTLNYHNYIYIYTSSTAQGGGGSFKNRKPIGEECCCGAKMAERSHWLTERWLCVFFWRHDGARQHSGSRRFLSAVARTKLPWLIPTAALPSCRQTQPRHFMVDGF